MMDKTTREIADIDKTGEGGGEVRGVRVGLILGQIGP